MVDSKTKKDENKTLFKSMTVKLKRELIKVRDELQLLRDSSIEEKSDFEEKSKVLESSLEDERQLNYSKVATLEEKVFSLTRDLEISESDYLKLQRDFENYKLKASQLLCDNKKKHSQDLNKTFDDERYQRLKELNDNQAKKIMNLEQQLANSVVSNQNYEKEIKRVQNYARLILEKEKIVRELKDNCDKIARENANLKLALQIYQAKLKDPNSKENSEEGFKDSSRINNNMDREKNRGTADEGGASFELSSQQDYREHNSSSSSDGSTSSYVHIKPNTFEIISGSSVLKDAQIQIDDLTKAYLGSESTNSLLSEQVKALKEEIRRMQRVSERMDLAENLEYLKNVLFKFLSLDDSQVEQRKRIVPVISTVLKLSPDETSKLNSMIFATKTNVASSFFKL